MNINIHPHKSRIETMHMNIYFSTITHPPSMQIGLIPPSHKILEQLPSPRMIKTHLQIQFLPQEIFEKKPKIIYIARNPKDVIVSDYHFHNTDVMLPTYKSWDDFVNDFMKGDGKFFSHQFLH